MSALSCHTPSQVVMRMQHNSSTTMQLLQLPAALTAHILQFVPQRQRLSCCVLVCSAWREAAAQATLHIDCELTSAAAAAALVAWLEQHGRRLESLALSFDADGGWRTLPLQLPRARLSRLQSLSLSSIRLPAISGSNSPAPAAGAGSSMLGGSGGGGSQTSDTPLLPKLKQLQLNNCHMHSLDTLVQLASSTELTSLVVDFCILTANNGQQQVSTALCTLLQRLPHLVVLQLPCIRLSRAAIKHVAGMGSLQLLGLRLAEDAFGDCLADLPSSLTRLQLWDYRERALKVAQPTLPAQLQQLTRLQQLQLNDCSMPPAVLASMSQLQHLHLQRCILLPCDADDNGDLAAATATLFGALQQLTRLQHLEIGNGRLAIGGPPPQQWAALTASSQLTHLSLVEWYQQPLPQGAAQHMFPAGRQLLRLQKLALSNSYGQPDCCLDSQDLGSIISCCPQLHDLNVYRTVRKDADVSALLQLPASCSSLRIGGVAFADAAASVVAQLTQLRDLSWTLSPQLTDLGLQQLTALQGLSQLHVQHCASISASMWAAAGVPQGSQHMDLVSTDTEGPVWRQLRGICDSVLA